MKKEYDFSKGVRGKFYRKSKIQKTIRFDEDVLKFFLEMSEDVGIPYQTLINMSLRKFAVEDAELNIVSPRKKKA
jgi:uncharacterized protein (DUF4415 family)